MNFNDLTKDQIDHVRKIYTNKDLKWQDRMTQLVAYLGKSERTVRKWCSEKFKLKEKPDVEPQQLSIARTKTHDKNKSIFLITSAQNATPINKAFFDNLKAYAKFLKAEILVIPYRYKNPTSMFTAKQESDDWWAKELHPYLTLNRHNLNNAVAVLSDIKIQPTCATPLNGLEGMTGDHSCVVGHPRMELKTIEVMAGCRPKIMLTTGACTKPNYTDSKNGKKGEFHHSTGFAIIELKDKEFFFPRQVSATNTGEFIDLFYSVKDGKVSREKEVEACSMGDIHVRQCNPLVTKITLDNLFKKLHPKKLFLHDIMDSESVTYHNQSDPFLLHKLELQGRNDLKAEVNEMLEWLKPFLKYDLYIAKSNHDEQLDKFLAITDWRKMTSVKNALPYMEYATAKLQGKAEKGIVPYIINQKYPKIKCLDHDESVMVKGWLMSAHGHYGSSGSRGNLNQFSRLSTKTVTGHSHTIGRVGGAVSVGTSTHLKLGYNKGASKWINAHGIVNRLGKFQHIIFFQTKGGLEYTTFN